MRPHIPKFFAGISAIISGVLLNLYAIVPHYTIQAYDNSVLSEMASTGARVNPGGPVLLAIPPINYTMIAAGCVLITVGILLLLTAFSRKGKSPITISH